MTRSTLVFLCLLCMACCNLMAQHYQININSPTDPPLEGNYKYTWTPTSECDFGIVPSGTIAVKWECVNGEVSSVTLDFAELEFASTDPLYNISYGASWVNAWHGPNGSNWNPTAPFYDIDLLKFTPVQVSNLTMGEVNLSMDFYITAIIDGEELGRVCSGTLALAPFMLNCPLCVEPMPVANFIVSDHYTISPGTQFLNEEYFELTDVSTPPNHNREWGVYYYKGNQQWWWEYSTDPVFTVMHGYTPGGAFRKIIFVKLRVWNCRGENTKQIHGSLLAGMASRSSELEEALFNTDEKSEIYPNLLASGEDIHCVLPQFEFDFQSLTLANILDLNGKVVYTQVLQGGDNLVPTAGIAPGIYFVQIMDGRNILAHQKLVVL